MENRDKEDIKLKLAICLNRIIADNKLIAKSNKAVGKKDHNLITSLRQLEAASGIDFATIQRISTGTKNASFSTIVALAEGLDMSPSEFLSHFTSITPEEMLVMRKKQSKNPKS